MTTHRTHRNPTENGHSRFANRGQSSEERMPEDDSAEKFAGPAADANVRPEGEGEPAQAGRAWGAGGSYGYGGAFEDGGQRGYDVSFVDPQPTANSGTSSNEDERKGYSQDAGYAQSGGNPAPGGNVEALPRAREPKKATRKPN